MEGNPLKPSGTQPWETLASAYAESRHVSADKLIEWPAQLKLCGDFAGKHILDIGCGTGEKSRHFAERGAASVTGIDASGGFASYWQAHTACSNLHFIQANFEHLPSLPALRGRHFDLIVSFQAIMYARDLTGLIQALADLLSPGGALVLSVPHPFRFAVLKNEIEGWGHGVAYQKTGVYRYPSPWKPEISLEHPTPRVSDYLHAILSTGLQLTACEEPAVTEEFRQLSPEKAAWMDRYVGILLFRAQSAPSAHAQS